MANAPYGVRLLVGAAVTAIEETRKLPQTVLMYPMTVVSQLAHLVMKMQQDVADMVIKGDETLESMFPPKDEQPEWATFDEDLGDDSPSPGAAAGVDGERLTEGRFALFTGGEPETSAERVRNDAASVATAEVPEIVAELDYESLTLAQLRARLATLKIADLEALLAYEETTKARAPFQTLLANRITRASAK
ncbi:lipid droplet-associated protein [Mycolicibacterium sp. XJ1819]